MSDRFATEVTIGGNLPRKEVKNLAHAITQDGLGIEYQDKDSNELCLYILSAAAKKEPLSFSNTEVANGATENLERFCQTHELSYVKRVEGKYEYNGEIHWWNPTMTEPKSWADTDIGAHQPMLSRNTLQKLKDRGKTLEAALEFLDSIAPPPPPLQFTSRKIRKVKSKPFDPFDL